ncbi:MAG: GNAT family N-acetyltransferase [Bacteroidales bacterium]|nr:GNAT family N-acetyltransferase [Bacteroidales bacterium]
MIEVLPVRTQQEKRKYVTLPFQIYKGNPYWIPPIKADEFKIFEPTTNPALKFCDAAHWIAVKDGKTVGRITAIINHAYNQKTGQPYGRFSRFECINDREISLSLFQTAENWLRERGMKYVHGPLGFTNLDLQGLLIEGFDQLPSIASVYHLPYYSDLIEAAGYKKEIDWVEFRLDVDPVIPEKVTRLVELVKERFGLRVVHFNSRKEMKQYAARIFPILNKAFDELPYVVPFDEETARFYTNKYFSILNPKFVKVIVDKNDDIRGFIIGLPSLSEAMQKARGRLLPFGIFHIMRALKHPKVIDLLLTAVEPELQRQGVPSLLMYELHKVAIKYGVKYVETTGIFETNQKAIQTWKNYSHIQHKRRRCYVKSLF